MKYVALLRGINVGGNRKVEMKRLKGMFEDLGYKNVSTYINSGNIIFESEENSTSLEKKIGDEMEKMFDDVFPVLVKTVKELREILKAIPTEWSNDAEQKTDVAYLFKEIDSEKVIDELPVNREKMDIRYTKGAIFWNVKRENYNASRLNKIIGNKLYKLMTVRNINTARFLGGL